MDRWVAVKVSRNQTSARRQTEKEAEVLRMLESKDRDLCKRLCNALLDSFVHERAHVCLVFQPLAVSLHDLLQDTGQRGLLLNDIRAISGQVLDGLSFLHGAGLVHTDLKCGNVMLRDGAFRLVPHPRKHQEYAPQMSCCAVVIIDFGGAVCPGKQGRGRPGARQIRSLEVVLGLVWDEGADLWACGCLLAALYTGVRLFSVHGDAEHLAVMERVLDERIPQDMALRTSERILARNVSFDNEGRLHWPGASSAEAVERVSRVPSLRSQICSRHSDFHCLLVGLLKMNPQERLSAAGARKNCFMECARVVE